MPMVRVKVGFAFTTYGEIHVETPPGIDITTVPASPEQAEALANIVLNTRAPGEAPLAYLAALPHRFDHYLWAEALLVVVVRLALRRRVAGGRDLIVDSAPILAWRRADVDAAVGHAPAHHSRPLLRGYRVHTLLCRGSGLPLLFLLSPANAHDAPFARPLLTWAIRLYGLRPRVIRLDAGYWGLRLIAWIHTALGAVAVIPWNPKRQKNCSCLPPTWTADELGKRSSIERFFGRVFSLFSCFRLQRPPLAGWSAIATQVALTYTATVVVGLAAHQAGRPDLIRSPKRVLAHTWEGW